MEIIKIELTKEEIIECLDKVTEEKEYISKMAEKGLPEEISSIVFAAYEKGCSKYNTRAWIAEEKYKKVAVKLLDAFAK